MFVHDPEGILLAPARHKIDTLLDAGQQLRLESLQGTWEGIGTGLFIRRCPAVPIDSP